MPSGFREEETLNSFQFNTGSSNTLVSIFSVFWNVRSRWVNDFLALGSLGRNDFDSVTSYMHCLVYHVPFFTKKYGKLLRFSGQGVEKINDDIKKNIHSKTNKWDATVDALQVRKRIEHLTSENCERAKRNYTKSTNEYWSDIIFRQRAAKKAKFLRKCHS